jgi:hypothetical protein
MMELDVAMARGCCLKKHVWRDAESDELAYMLTRLPRVLRRNKDSLEASWATGSDKCCKASHDANNS